jgi:hypothetical protein
VDIGGGNGGGGSGVRGGAVALALLGSRRGRAADRRNSVQTLFSVRIKWLLGSYVTLPNNHDKGYWMGGRNVTFQLNVYTVAISFATKIVINEWLPLNKTGFLMYLRP